VVPAIQHPRARGGVYRWILYGWTSGCCLQVSILGAARQAADRAKAVLWTHGPPARWSTEPNGSQDWLAGLSIQP
jgi:hypothetical protein